MKNITISILLILLGILILIITFKDNKTRKPELTTSYIMHLKGFIGSFVLILIGILILLK
jgi:prolipoprotein diacylglyceryltransferase